MSLIQLRSATVYTAGTMYASGDDYNGYDDDVDGWDDNYDDDHRLNGDGAVQHLGLWLFYTCSCWSVVTFPFAYVARFFKIEVKSTV